MTSAHSFPSADGLWTGLRLAPGAAPDAALPADTEAAIAVTEGTIRWVGARDVLPAEFAALAPHDGGGALVTPGLVDCHTHLVFAGQRADEFALRLQGLSYEEIARRGGGIVSTVRTTRMASEEQLYEASAGRLENLLSEGVTAVEIKSGYGLDLATERKQLRIARLLFISHSEVAGCLGELTRESQRVPNPPKQRRRHRGDVALEHGRAL